MIHSNFRAISVLGLATGLCLGVVGSPGGIALAQPAPEQAAQPRVQDPQAGNTSAPATSRGLKEFLSGLLDAIRENDSARVSAAIDTDRMFAEIERQQIASTPTPGEKTAFRIALKMTVPGGLLEEGTASGWRDFRVHRPGKLDEAGTTVLVHMLNKDGRPAGLVQFWLACDAPGAWKIYDWQEASSIFKTSSLAGMTVAAFREEPSATKAQKLFAAAKEASQGDMAAAERTVLELVNEPLPPALDGPRWLLYAQIKFSQKEPGKALECLDQAVKYDPDMIALPKIKALIYADLRNPARSLACANEAREALGEDPEVDALLGNALAQLNRQEEAKAAFRRGLDADPDVVANLIGLASVLPAGQKGEIATRFGKCSDPAATLPAVAEALANAGDHEALETVTAGAARLGVEAALLDDCRARAAWLKGQTDEAVKLTEAAINHAGTDEARRFYADRLLDIRLAAGHSVEAYLESGEPEHAFTHMARRLSEAEQADALLALAQAHVKRLSMNADGYFYEGRALLLKQRYEEAAKVLAKGMSLTKPGTQHESFRTNLVLALYKSGRGQEAYRDVAPQRATLAELAGLYLSDRQPQQLLELLAAHRKNDPGDARVNAWEAQARMLLADHAGAARVLKTAIAGTSAPARTRTLVTKLLDAHLAAKTPAAGYVEAPDPAFAFRYLCERLVAERDVAGLNAVIKAHRAKSPGDVLLHVYAGQAYMLAGDYRAAEQEFIRGQEQATSPTMAAGLINDRLRARCHMGEALKTYNGASDKAIAYRLLVPLLVEMGRGDDLAAIVKTHRGVAPAEPSLGLWEAESRWMAHDYQGTVDVLLRDRDAILADSDLVSRYDDRLVRSLVRLKKFPAAAEAAKASTERDGDPWFEAVVAVCSGSVDRSRPLVERCVERGYTLADFDGDADLAAVFKSGEFHSLRDTLPASR
jgi:tetratricopeptide (TPR) repeat protein